MASMEEIRQAQRAKGPATVLGIGTATPVNCYYQADYPDFFFRVTKCEHKTELKKKFQRICQKTMIRKRYLHLTEDILKEKPNMRTYKAPSLDDRQEIVIEEVPKLGAKAALEAIKEWGQHKSRITHLVFCTTTSVHVPGADYQLAKLLDLPPTVNRLMLYLQGCYGSGTVLRVGKDIAENNAGARVLVVCAEITVMTFHAPEEDQLGCLVGQALFGDGAGAVIIGADPDLSIEHPIFQLACAKQRWIPNSEHHIEGFFREMGLFFHLSQDITNVISAHIENSISEVFRSIGVNIKDWNSLFWVIHAGGRAILDGIQGTLALKEDKLDVTRHVLAEYGNVASACALFVLDEMRKKSLKDGKTTTGDGLDWGVLIGFGPGMTIETIVLQSVQIDDAM